MIQIDCIKIEKNESADVLFVFIAKENNLFYVWSSEFDWEHQDLNAVRKSSNQYKSSQTAFEVFNFFADSFESIAEDPDESSFDE